jgi:HEAT repeat protein
MASKRIPLIVILIIMVSVAAVAWVTRYHILYCYYLWKLDRTSDGKEMLIVTDNIEAISPHIVPLLVRTYEDSQASAKVRNAAALSLVKVDREKAETLSIKFLQDKGSEVLAIAIFVLGEAKSTKEYTTVVQYADSKNERVRWSVVTYLGKVRKAESVSTLRRIHENDPSERVRGWAAYYLNLLEVLPSK